MRKITVRVSTNKVGSECKRSFTIDDEADNEEIEETAMDEMFKMINWDYEVTETDN